MPAAVIDPGDNGNYDVDIDPAAFTSVVDHPYLPKLAGARWEYRSTDPHGEVEIITIEVLDEHRMVMGVEAIVVHDIVTNEDGELVEDTYDWFAQDDDGNVWYFGEDTTSYHDGVASDAGSWEAGVGGALPGIVMPATPEVTAVGYRQEYLAGEAEDMGQVIAELGRGHGACRQLRRRDRHPRLDPARTRHRRGEDLRPRRRVRPGNQAGRPERRRTRGTGRVRPKPVNMGPSDAAAQTAARDRITKESSTQRACSPGTSSSRPFGNKRSPNASAPGSEPRPTTPPHDCSRPQPSR